MMEAVMTFDWQNVAALAIVLTAAVYLIRRAWRTVAKKRAGGCGACGSCPAGSADATAKTLVQLQPLAKPRGRS
jgi:hypothetical protein